MAKLPEIPIDDILGLVQGPDQDIARQLHSMGERLDCKIEVRAGLRDYRIVYNTRKPKRSLYTIEVNKERWRVKANLFHMDPYRATAEACSNTIRDAIKATPQCKLCNTKCGTRQPYTLDGQQYMPCSGAGNYFSNLSTADWQDIIQLIELESGAV